MHSIGAAPAFAADGGAADPVLTEALGAFAAAPALWARVVAALTNARLLVPVVATETGDRSSAGGEGGADMALALLVGEDGRQAVPAFTSLDALARWDPEARPVPVEARRAALVAATASGGAGVLVIDVAGPVPFVLEEPVVGELASGRSVTPLYDSPAVTLELQTIATDVDGVVRARVEPDADADARLVLTTAANDPAIATVVAARLHTSDVVRDAVLRGLAIAVEADGV